MPYAVEVALDPRASRIIRELWQALSDVGVTSLPDSGAEPHVTLAIWERIDRAPFETAVAAFAGETAPIDVTFDAVGTFPGGAVFLRPADTAVLVECQRRLHARLAALGHDAWGYYLPEYWVPHCTLAMDVPADRVAEALAVAERSPLPLTGRLESVGIVEFRPVRELARYRLGG